MLFANLAATQQVAALVAVVSVAIVGVAILLIPPTWKGFKDTSFGLDVSAKRVIGRNVLCYSGSFLLLVFITNFLGIYAPSLVQPVVRSLFFLALIILLIYTIISLIMERRRKAQPSPGMELLPFLYNTTLFWIAWCILFCLIALIGVAPTMLNIEIGPYNQDNYNWARWFLSDGILFFILGVFSFASTYISQIIRAKKRTEDTVEKKPSLGWIVSLIVVLCLFLASIFAMAKQFSSTEEFINVFLAMPLDVEGSVSIRDAQFRVTNESDFDWESVTFSLNEEGFSSGYTISCELLGKGETYIVDITEFAKSDGTRFNLATVKPLRFSIDVYNSEGRSGIFSGALEKVSN